MKKLTGLFTAVIIILISCEREISVEVDEGDAIETVNAFHDKYRDNHEIFTTSALSPTTISTSKGAKLYLPSNGFVTVDDKQVSGNIEVSVKEIYTPMEMIFNNMPTVSDNKLLESGGEFQITVTQNNTPLKMAPNNFIKITLPNIGRDMKGMQVFNGVTNAAGEVNWVLNAKPGNFVVGDSTLFSNYNVFSDDVNWINVDKFVNEPTVEFTVHPGNVPSGDSTNVFVHLTGRNTVVKMNWTQGLNYFKSDMLLAVPSTIVGLSTKNGKLYASVIPVHIQNGSSITMNFLPYTEKQLKSQLSKLH
jgi:hypothetical protein